MRLAGYIDRGLTSVQAAQEAIRQEVADVRAVQATLDPDWGSGDQRHAQFQTLREQFQGSDNPTRQHIGRVMASFEPGLCVGGDDTDLHRTTWTSSAGFASPKATSAAFMAAAIMAAAMLGFASSKKAPHC